MPQILLLADDLTGAADAANAFTRSGLTAAVQLSSKVPSFPVDILAVDCDTRRLSAKEAEAATKATLRSLLKQHPNLPVFKKIDSTLRGHLAVELRAVSQVLQESQHMHPLAVVAPAFPSAGRTTQAGTQYLHETPLHKTETWRHAAMTGEANLPQMLQGDGMRVHLYQEHGIREPSPAYLDPGIEAIICDARTDADLSRIAHVFLQLPNVFWVGSAGLAYALAKTLKPSSQATTSIPANAPHKPCLFVVGSQSSLSQRQAETLSAHGGEHTIRVSPATLLTSPHSYRDRISASLKHHVDTIIVLDAKEMVPGMDRQQLTLALGNLIEPFAKEIGALVAAGGETARAILDHWGVTSLTLHGEVEPGLPCSLADIHGMTIPVLTKAGAFGTETTLLACRQFIDNLLKNSGR